MPLGLVVAANDGHTHRRRLSRRQRISGIRRALTCAATQAGHACSGHLSEDLDGLILDPDGQRFPERLGRFRVDDEVQFDVVAFRLKSEYKVECGFEPVAVTAARWVGCEDDKQAARLRDKLMSNLALDHAGELVYLAPSTVNLQLTEERWPEVTFNATREQL